MIGFAFTPEQFKTLLNMVYIANTVANGGSEELNKKYDDLEQYIFSRAKDAGVPGATWSHKAGGDKHHHPSQLFEKDPEINTLLDKYDSAVAIATLSEMLAERDIERKHGPAAKTLLPQKHYDELFDLYAEQYEEEFEKFGLGRLVIVKETQGDGNKSGA